MEDLSFKPFDREGLIIECQNPKEFQVLCDEDQDEAVILVDPSYHATTKSRKRHKHLQGSMLLSSIRHNGFDGMYPKLRKIVKEKNKQGMNLYVDECSRALLSYLRLKGGANAIHVFRQFMVGARKLERFIRLGYFDATPYF